MTDRLSDQIPWVSVLALATTVMAAFGIIFYGFSVYLTEEAAGSEFSTSVLSLAFGGSILTGGALAAPIGRFADRYGIRLIIAVGTTLGALGLLGFAGSDHSWQVVAVWWLLLGPAGAMTFYEPAFVAVDQWCTPEQRPRVIGVLTVIGGLAGVIFLPLTERLVAAVGWRSSAAILGAVLFGIGTVTWLFAMPRTRVAVHHDAKTRSRTPLSALIRDRRFLLYTVGIMLTFLATQGVFSHRVARFEESGFAVAGVAAWAAAASALSLPGRWIAPLLTTRFRATAVQAIATGLMGVAALLTIDGGSTWQMVGHFTIFGLAFGAMLPLRALAMADWYSGFGYGRVMGLQWTAAGFAGAIGPVIVGVGREQANGYGPAMATIAVIYALAVGLIAASGRHRVRTG